MLLIVSATRLLRFTSWRALSLVCRCIASQSPRPTQVELDHAKDRRNTRDMRMQDLTQAGGPSKLQQEEGLSARANMRTCYHDFSSLLVTTQRLAPASCSISLVTRSKHNGNQFWIFVTVYLKASRIKSFARFSRKR